MAESVYSQIVAAMVTRIQSIEADHGATYWTTFAHVLVHPAFTPKCLATSEDTVCVLSPGPETKEPFTFGRVKSIATFDVAVAHRFSELEEDPFNPPVPDRLTLQSRMARDIEKAMLRDFAEDTMPPLGVAGVHGIDVGEVDRTAENTFLPAFSVAFMPVRIHFDYPETTP